MAPKNRRRSSNFRPTLYYDLKTIKQNDMELLPIVLLEMIFSYLNPTDLLSVCRASRLFYLPAMTQLYENIIVVHDPALMAFVYEKVEAMPLFFGTLVPYQNVPKLIHTLTNSTKISRWVRSIKFLGTQVDYSADGGQFGQLVELLGTVNLVGFFNSSVGVQKFNQLSQTSSFDNLRKLCISVDEQPIEHGTLDCKLPQLKELIVYYSNSDESAHNMEVLAEALTLNGTLSRLESLEFDEKINKDLNILNESNNNTNLTIWVNFFNRVSEVKKQHSIPRCQSLVSLKLDGFIDNAGRAISRILSESFDLNNLRSLRLFITEFSHHHNEHYPNSTSLIKNLIQHCPNLEDLGLNPTFDCLTCQFNNIEQTLQEIAQRHIPLRNFSLRFELMNNGACQHIFDMIPEMVPETIEQLTVFDKSNQVQNENEFRRHIGASQYGHYERLVYDFQVLITNLFKFDNHFSVNRKINAISEHMLHEFMAENHAPMLQYNARYLERGFGRYLERFPRLKTFTINGIPIQRSETVAARATNGEPKTTTPA